jgi:hypothetical protein
LKYRLTWTRLKNDAGDDQVDEENNACAYVIYSTNVPSGDHTQQKFKLLSILPWRIHTANAIHVIGDFIIFRTQSTFLRI